MKELILNNFRGCGACQLAKNNIDCKKLNTPVKITFKEAQKNDNWGRFVTVFRKGDVIRGEAVIKDNIVYCASAKSNIYEEHEDFVRLENIEINL